MKKTVALVLLFILIVGIMTGCNTTKEPVHDKLTDIYNNLKSEGSDYTYLVTNDQQTTYDASLGNGKIIITRKDANGSNAYEFVFDGDYIVYVGSNDNFYGAYLFSCIEDAIARTNGMNPHLVSSYINGLAILGIDNNVFSSETDEEKNTTTFKIYAKDKFEMPELSQMIVDDSILSDYEKLSENSRAFYFNIGKITAVVNGDKDNVSIIVGEYDSLSDLAYKSLINLVRYFEPTGYGEFLNNYSKLEEQSNDSYTVKYLTDPDELAYHVMDGLDKTHKFIKVVFGTDSYSYEQNAEEYMPTFDERVNDAITNYIFDTYDEKIEGVGINDLKIYSEEEMNSLPELKEYNKDDLIAFSVEYTLMPAKGVDTNSLLAGNGRIDENGEVVKNNVGIMKQNEDGTLEITKFETGF